MVGQNFDPADLVDEQKLVNFIYENSGRRDLVFKNFTSLTYWKSVIVISLVLRWRDYNTYHTSRPKIMMINKFHEGRVFIVGGASPTVKDQLMSNRIVELHTDAAHVHSATGGQGLNTSVQDSVSALINIA